MTAEKEGTVDSPVVGFLPLEKDPNQGTLSFICPFCGKVKSIPVIILKNMLDYPSDRKPWIWNGDLYKPSIAARDPNGGTAGCLVLPCDEVRKVHFFLSEGYLRRHGYPDTDVLEPLPIWEKSSTGTVVEEKAFRWGRARKIEDLFR